MRTGPTRNSPAAASREWAWFRGQQAALPSIRPPPEIRAKSAEIHHADPRPQHRHSASPRPASPSTAACGPPAGPSHPQHRDIAPSRVAQCTRRARCRLPSLYAVPASIAPAVESRLPDLSGAGPLPSAPQSCRSRSCRSCRAAPALAPLHSLANGRR